MSNKIYIGIDPSFTNTGVVVIYGETMCYYEIPIPKITGDCAGELKRMESGLKQIIDVVSEFKRVVGLIYGKMVTGMEVPMGSNIGGGAKIGKLFGYIAGVLYPEHNLMTFTPPQIKKFFTGHGNANKELMVWFANNVWDFECTSHDIADAFAIAMMVKYIDEGKYEL